MAIFFCFINMGLRPSVHEFTTLRTFNIYLSTCICIQIEGGVDCGVYEARNP